MGSGNLLLPLLLLMMLAFLFFSFRKQKKRMNETAEMQNSVGVGAKVMTTTGLYATVVGLDQGADDDTIELEIAPGITTRWTRRAVAKVLTPEETGAPTIETIDDQPGFDPDIDSNPAPENGFDKRPDDR